jgi:hypothetical protein
MNKFIQLVIAITLLAIIYVQHDVITKLKVKSNVVENISSTDYTILNNQIDSLRNELFVNEMQVARYEIALELLKEQNQNAANEFELIFTTQTE